MNDLDLDILVAWLRKPCVNGDTSYGVMAAWRVFIYVIVFKVFNQFLSGFSFVSLVLL